MVRFDGRPRLASLHRLPPAVIALSPPSADRGWTWEWLAVPDLRRHREMEAVVRDVLARVERFSPAPGWEVVAAAVTKAWERRRATASHRRVPRLDVEPPDAA
jgi:hypothetical protein